jgi:hypothetical protein
MRSAFIEVHAIREDVNARRRKGERPEKEYYELALCRWNNAIAALAECLGRVGPGVAPEPLTDPCLSLSTHTARATQ